VQAVVGVQAVVLGQAAVWQAAAVVEAGAGADVLLKRHRTTKTNLLS